MTWSLEMWVGHGRACRDQPRGTRGAQSILLGETNKHKPISGTTSTPAQSVERTMDEEIRHHHFVLHTCTHTCTYDINTL